MSKNGNVNPGLQPFLQPFLQPISQFARNCAELLSVAPDCTIPFDKFVPAYNIHFKKPLKLSNYGFGKLIDLLEAVSGTVKVAESGNAGRLVRLTHSKCGAHLDRFRKECVELLTLAPKHTIPIDMFDEKYHQHFGRQIKLSNYGFEKSIDLLKAVPDTVQVSEKGKSTRPISLKDSLRSTIAEKRKDHLNMFRKECVELLTFSPKHTIAFDKFVSEYNSHFKKPLKLSNYGFGKLIDLLKAVSGTVKVAESGNAGRPVRLTEKHLKLQLAQESTETFGKEERRKEFALECTELLMNMPDCKISLKSFQDQYKQYFGRPCRPSDYGFNDEEELFRAMPDLVMVTGSGDCPRFCGCRIVQLTELTLHSNVDQPQMQNDTPNLASIIIDVEDGEEGM